MRTTAATDELLREEAWKSERVINAFRAVIWLILPGGILTWSVASGRVVPPSAVFGLCYGTLVLVFGLSVLRRSYHPLMPFVLTTFDLIVLALIMDASQRQLREVVPAEAEHQLYQTAPALMLVISANAMRFSWQVSVWSVACACAAYAWVLARFDASLGIASGVDFAQFIMFGAILVYASRKLRIVIHRVKERDAFARFLPGPAVERLSRDPSALHLGGEQQEATVLFSDIRGFTAMSEQLSAERVVALLNEYFREMVEEIFAHQGILDKFIGDGICAVFGPPLADQDQAKRSIDCARGMLARLEKLNHVRAARGEPTLSIGIGIHTGPLVAGNIGSPLRMEYTHIGDTVNTASRIEGLTKELGEPLLVSAATVEKAREAGTYLRELGPVSVRGKDLPFRVFAAAPVSLAEVGPR
jgi:adenylate cyclase